MSTHKNIDRICAVIVIAAILVTCLFMNGEALGIQNAEQVMGYETRLFDTTYVHTLDIEMDDWDAFIEGCEDEEYEQCAVVIDSEAYRNVAIRAKGNTSLSQVAQMNSSRYSFKIEFDHYDKTKTYHGLDKLSLNNIIQDTTFMKDYLTYRLMGAFGVDAPLVSYVYITVNGEDWGLYLAVEGVEDAFLQRNYGSDSGNLYKPDSQSFGGGRGNGREFDIQQFMKEREENASETEDSDSGSGTDSGASGAAGASDGDSADGSAAFDGEQGFPGGMMMPPEGFDFGSESGFEMPEGFDFGGAPEGFDFGSESGLEMPEGFDFGGAPEGFDFGTEASASDAAEGQADGGTSQSGESGQSGASGQTRRGRGGFGGGFGGGMGGGGGMGADDVKLKYTDDDFDSYSNIFENAKTDLTDEDKARLIASLKSLGEQDDIESVVDVDEVLRYMVVHNFVVNGDSYTGSMVHNYYLYEKDGVLSMIPWDYNLAFGTFQSNDAGSAVNDPIDTPLSVDGSGERPMADWIWSDESYTELYHQYFSEFLETVDIQTIIDETAEMIAPYVEKDPTKFYTYEEFETGVETLKRFCELRAESILGQLAGTIPSTDEGQAEDDSALVDASEITLSDMGSMNNGRGNGDGNGGEDGMMPGGMAPGGEGMMPPGGSESDGAMPNYGGASEADGDGSAAVSDSSGVTAGQGDGAAPPDSGSVDTGENAAADTDSAAAAGQADGGLNAAGAEADN